MLEQLIQAGMNVARLNLSHGTLAEHSRIIASLRKTSSRLNTPISILLDVAGPKIRIGKIEDGTIRLESGDLFTLTARKVRGTKKEVSVSYPLLPKNVRPGDTLLLSDGMLELKVLETDGRDIKCRVVIGGPLSSKKGINLPSRSLTAPCLTEKDKKDLAFGLNREVDYIALSFVRTAEDVLQAKRIMKKAGSFIPLIAKIEKHEALVHINEIIRVIDGIMIARGDLGVETPLENVPSVQKSLIHKSNLAGKPVITATQMLRSMVDNPRPTRAEVTDVANAVLDGTDAVMLSEETAIGKYPVEAVATMKRIAEDAEAIFPFEIWMPRTEQKGVKSIPEAISCAACNLAGNIQASLIITFTQSGSTARLVAKCRPRHLILAPTPLEKTFRQLALIWGVIPILSKSMKNTDEMVKKALAAAFKSGYVQPGQKVVITAGYPVGEPGTTNLIKAAILK